MLKGEKQWRTLFRSSQISKVGTFKSLSNGKYLHFQTPTLQNDGTAFELSNENFVMLNGQYLSIGNVKSNGNIQFATSSNPEFQWNGLTLLSTSTGKVIDMYDTDSKNVKLWDPNGHLNQHWQFVNAHTHDNDAIEYHIRDKTNQTSVFFPIANPVVTIYRGKQLDIDNYIFFTDATLLHDKHPQVRMPAILMTVNTFDQIVADSQMTHDNAFGTDNKTLSVSYLSSRQVGGTFDMSVSGTSWKLVWKFPADMFSIPIWSREIRTEVSLPVGFYELTTDFGPNMTSNVNVPLDKKVFKMRRLVNGINLHTILSILRSDILPMVSWEYYIYNPVPDPDPMWNNPTASQKQSMTRMFQRLKQDFNVQAFPCHGFHHAAIVFYTHNDQLMTCELLSSFLKDSTFVSVLKTAVLPNMKNVFQKWVGAWTAHYKPSSSSSMPSSSAILSTTSEET
jgi:hypothetical protein